MFISCSALLPSSFAMYMTLTGRFFTLSSIPCLKLQKTTTKWAADSPLVTSVCFIVFQELVVGCMVTFQLPYFRLAPVQLSGGLLLELLGNFPLLACYLLFKEMWKECGMKVAMALQSLASSCFSIPIAYDLIIRKKELWDFFKWTALSAAFLLVRNQCSAEINFLCQWVAVVVVAFIQQ